MEETVLERVKAIILTKSRSILAFSKEIGMGQNTLNQYVNGRRKLSLEAILLILNTFDDISAEWLLRGKGSMTGNTPAETPIYNNSDVYDLIDKFNDASQRARLLAEENNRLKEELNLLNNSRKMKKT